MPLRKTICITFPRSGHHLLVDCLIKYFGKDVAIPSLQGEDSAQRLAHVLPFGDFVYCERYAHCRMTPCTDSQVNFQKTHDRDLDLDLEKNIRQVIQYRNPLESLASLYFLWLDMQRGENTKTNWLYFLSFGYLKKSKAAELAYQRASFF